MIFKSKNDYLFLSIIYLVILMLVAIFIMDYYDNGIKGAGIWIHVVDLLVVIILLWMFHGTYYVITETHIRYRCGPFRGRVRVTNIKEIINGKTLWVGYRPATSRKGLVIKFNKYDEIYFSPQRAEEFIVELLKINPKINVVNK